MKKQTLLIGLAAAVVLSTCSGMNNLGQMMVDAGELMMDAGNGNAQTNTPQKVVTAQTDLTQQVGGLVRLSSATELVAGPVVVLDLFANNESSSSVNAEVWLASTTCNTAAPAEAVNVDGYHAGRIFVPAGQRLCALATFGTASVSWAGFRPY